MLWMLLLLLWMLWMLLLLWMLWMLWMLLRRKLLLVLLVVRELNLHILHWHLRLSWRSNFHICENSIDELDISPVVRHEETSIRMAASNYRLMSDHGINCAGIAWRSRGTRLSTSILVTIHNTAPKTLRWIVHRLSGGTLLP